MEIKKRKAVIFIASILVTFSCTKDHNHILLSEFKNANALYIKGETEKSLAILSEIEKQAPAFTQALFLSGKIYFMQGNFAEAREKWEKILKKKPYHVNTGKWLIRIYILEERHDIAEDLLLKLLEISPEDPDLLFLGGRLKKDEGKYLEAIEYYKKGFLFEERLIEAHLDMAEIYGMFGIREKAVAHLEKAASTGGEKHELYRPVKSLLKTME